MSPNRSWATLGIAIGWGLFVIVGVRVGESGFGLWKHKREALDQAQEQRGRLQGWLDVEKQLKERQEEVWGPFSRVARTDLSRAAFQGLQQVAQEQGVNVIALRPSHLPGQGRQPGILHLDAKIEGQMEQVSGLIRRLPESMPGVRLESLQLVPQGESHIQVFFRLSLPELER